MEGLLALVPFVMFAGGALVVVILVRVVVLQGKKTTEAWATSARALGLSFHPPGFLQARRLEGTVENFRVQVSTYSRGGSKNRRAYTRYRVTYPSLRMGLALTHQHMLSSMATWFGGQDIEVGDKGFDDSVVVKGRSPQRILEFLNAGRRARISRFLRSHGMSRIDDESIEWSARGHVRNASTLVRNVKELVDLAGTLTKDRGRDRVLRRVIEAKREGRISDALGALQGTGLAPEPAPPEPTEVEPGVEEKVLEAQLLHLADRTDDSREAFKQALELAPEDPEIREWVESYPASPSPPAPPGDTSLEVLTVCATLFAEDVSAFDATRRFDQDYAGKPVTWQGTLRAVEAYSFEYVFGSDPGVKALVEIYEIPATVYSDNQVLAVVQLPVGSEDQLKERIGSTVTIEGTLKKVDGFMKNVFIEAGRVE